LSSFWKCTVKALRTILFCITACYSYCWRYFYIKNNLDCLLLLLGHPHCSSQKNLSNIHSFHLRHQNGNC
jgi:hypothetical protein